MGFCFFLIQKSTKSLINIKLYAESYIQFIRLLTRGIYSYRHL